jgi:bifunctional UDP-N-acetylglucosamine pyrophosphorylase/glucosamine-1-phosphate N-acetyltransferase
VTDTGPAAVVVLAAGQGTRMKSALAKVLHAMCGRSMLGHVLAAAGPLAPQRSFVVVGQDRDEVVAHLSEIAPDAVPVDQPEQHGTGHAVRMALEAAPELLEGTVLVLPGDSPLLTAETLQRLVEHHDVAGAAATLLSAEVPDPTGYGRVVRDPAGTVRAIVE